MRFDAFIGIDLGTTNCTCAILKSYENQSLELLQLPIHQTVEYKSGESIVDTNLLLASTILLDSQNAYTGLKFNSINSISAQQLYIQNIKMMLGNDYRIFQVEGKKFNPAEISSLLLATIYHSIKQNIAEDQIKSIIITIPASFSSKMRRATMDAALIAGIDISKVSLIDEPIAAIMDSWNQDSQAFNNIPFDDPIMVFDIGGGTLDVTLVNISHKSKVLDIIATSRYNEIGGNDIDSEISSFLIHCLKRWNIFNSLFSDQIDIQTQRNYAQKIVLLAEEVKEKLNELLVGVDVNGGIEGALEYCKEQKFKIKIAIDAKICKNLPREDFIIEAHEIINCLFPLIAKKNANTSPKNIYKPIYDVITKAGLSIHTLKNIYVVGGASKFCLLAIELRSFFRNLNQDLDPFFSISSGAAKFSFLLSERQWLVKAKTNEKIYLRRNGLPFLEILSDKLDIPSLPQKPIKELKDNDTIEFTEGASTINLEFYQGISENDPAMSIIHIENHQLPTILLKDTVLNALEGKINSNKIYEFRFDIIEPDNNIIKFDVNFSDTMQRTNSLSNTSLIKEITLNGGTR